MKELHANILAPDCRACGESEGNWVGFGWPDRLDVASWIDYIIQHKGEDHQIVLCGISMGAATILSSSGEALPSNVKAICADCGYDSLKDLFEYLIHRYAHIPPAQFIWSADFYFKKWFGYRLSDVQPIAQVSKTNIPILFIHGAEDHFVPTKMSLDMYDACHSPEEKLIVPKAGHAMSALLAEELYFSTMRDFFNLYISQ